MAFLDNLSKKITDASQTTMQKGKDMADIVKYNSMIGDEEKKLSRVFESLGRRYVEIYGNNPDPIFSDYMTMIAETKKNIHMYHEKIKELRGLTTCPSCNSEVPQGSVFCAVCGTKMAEPEPSEAEVKYCRNCGHALREGVRFCGTCGTPVDVNKKEPIQEEAVSMEAEAEEAIAAVGIVQEADAAIEEATDIAEE